MVPHRFISRQKIKTEGLIFLINIGLVIVLEALEIELEIVVNVDHRL